MYSLYFASNYSRLVMQHKPKTSKEEQRQEMLVTEDETMVEVFHGRDEPEEFPRAQIGEDFSADEYDEYDDYDD
ncbi:hypothetical protein MTO96_010048 [Rhipicephalus appendiculatus]